MIPVQDLYRDQRESLVQGAKKWTEASALPPPPPLGSLPSLVTEDEFNRTSGQELPRHFVDSYWHQPETVVTPERSTIHLNRTTHGPSPLRPYPLSKRRKGYWNRRGDHITSEGYIVYPPGPLVYPEDLDDYPDGKNAGYMNEYGTRAAWALRPELSISQGDYESLIEWIEVDERANYAMRMLAKILGSVSDYRKFLKSTEAEAELLLNVLHKLLDSRHVPDHYRGSTVSAMMRLCKASGTYPRRLDLQGVKFEPTPLTSGAYGEIFQGELGGLSVSLKVNRVFRRSEHDVKYLISTYAKEAVVWSQLKHQNLLPFYGIYRLEKTYGHGRIALVSPWMQNGNISEYLGNNPEAARLPLILDTLQGLNYLHIQSIVHGDLKGANILITPEGSACLADFGLSSIDHPDILQWTSLSTVSPVGGTPRWQAPEMMIAEDTAFRPTRKSDIYSVASVMYEVFVGQVPYYEYRNSAAVLHQVIMGRRPTKPSPAQAATLELTEDIWTIMEQCWATFPEKRPTIEEVVALCDQAEPNALTFTRLTERERHRLSLRGSRIPEPRSSMPYSQDFRKRLEEHELDVSDAELELLERLTQSPSTAPSPFLTSASEPPPSPYTKISKAEEEETFISTSDGEKGELRELRGIEQRGLGEQERETLLQTQEAELIRKREERQAREQEAREEKSEEKSHSRSKKFEEQRAWLARQFENREADVQSQREELQRQNGVEQKTRPRKRNFSVHDMQQIYAFHETKWNNILRKKDSELRWTSFPWPMFMMPTTPDAINGEAILAYLSAECYPESSGDIESSVKQRIESQMQKWAPDRLETKFLPRVVEGERSRVKKAAGIVFGCLQDLFVS